ncbi:MAG: hypothetical protein RR471_09620 [Bacteroides sp.]
MKSTAYSYWILLSFLFISCHRENTNHLSPESAYEYVMPTFEKAYYYANRLRNIT